VKYFLLTFYTILFFSCKESDKKPTESNIISNLKDKTWISKQYKDVLYKSNSVFNAENSSPNDENLVFHFFSKESTEFHDSSKKIPGTEVTGYNPYWMEKRFYILKNDSIIVDREGKYLFKVSKLINDTLILDFPKRKRKFVISNNDNIYESLSLVNKEWFAGQYVFTHNSKSENINFNKDGTIDQSEILGNYKTYDIYACKGEACSENFTLLVLSEDNTNLKTLSFIIEQENSTNDKIVLSEIYETEDIDSPIRRNGKVMILKKVVNNTYK